MASASSRTVHPTRTRRPLTDLEGAALGSIHSAGALSAYAIRSRFRDSPSALFSDSAGTVYPMVTRLARRGLLRERRVKQGRREATLYSCTPAGRAALREWLRVPEPSALVTWDPLRTRALSLDALTPGERRRWVEDALEAVRAHVGHIRSVQRTEPVRPPWARLAHRNVLLQARTRLRWLREVAAALDTATGHGSAGGDGARKPAPRARGAGRARQPSRARD